MKLSNHNKLGGLLGRQGVISQEELEHALSVQRHLAIYKPLGEILRQLGFVSRLNLRDAIVKYRKQIRLGHLLIKMGTVSYMELRQALEDQKETQKRLGEILVENRARTRSALIDSLSIQLGVPKVTPNVALVDKKLLNGISIAFLHHKRIIPLNFDKEKNLLTVVMDNPLDQELITDLEKIFSARIEPAISTADINLLIDQLSDTWIPFCYPR